MRFDNWNLQMDSFPVRQYDNLTRRLEVSGDIPEGWSWVALLSIGDNLNIISLKYGEPGLYVDLTADMIPYAGKYNLQLKATQGEKVRHTNIVSMTVNESMSGDVQWPELPSAFSQAVEQAQEAANTAKEAALQYPKIIDGYWWVYDANSGKFVNSGIYAGGSSPYIGQNGNWFVGDEDTGIAATGQQGWSVSTAALDEDGALVLTIRNPADGSTQTLPPVPIDNSAALQAVVESITAQGTAQVQRVETAGSTAVGEVSTAKDAALQAVGQAQSTAVQAVQDAQGSATTAIGAAQTAAVEAVEAKGAEEQGKLNAIVPPPTPEDAGKVLVANADGTGLKYGDAPGGAGIDDAVIATDSTWSSRMIVDSLAPEFSETGAVVTCNPVAGYPLSIQAQIVPVQEGEGDPSPDNVRPIRGWTEVNLWVGGKNLWDAHMLTNGEFVTYENREMFKYTDGCSAFVWPVPKRLRNEQLTFTSRFYRDDPWKPVNIRFKHISKSYNQIFLEQGVVYSYPTRPANGLLESISGYDNYSRPVYMDLTVTQLELGASATNYEPHRGRTITFPFGQTIYGGTLNWATGVLTVTQAEIASYDGENLPGAWISDRDVYSQGATPTIGAQVVYELAEPQAIQLTPQEILALSGVNTIYSDTGNVTVSGRADPNAVIQQLAARIAALESAAVANA